MNVDRQVALGDLLLFTPLALPGVGPWIVDLLLRFNAVAALPGTAGSDALTGLLVNLLGLFGVSFAWIRLRGQAAAWRRHAIAVKAAAALLILIAVVAGAPALLIVIAVADIGAAIALTVVGARAGRTTMA